MDTKTLLRSLNAHKVHFVIIGATAAIAHGFTRATKDIDIFVQPTKDNMQRALKALQDCGYDLQDTTVEEALEKKLLLRGYILQTDLHPFVRGIDFETLWKNKIKFKFQGEEAYFSSLDDLIQMKEAAGRAQDLEDLRHLREIKKQIQKK